MRTLVSAESRSRRSSSVLCGFSRVSALTRAIAIDSLSFPTQQVAFTLLSLAGAAKKAKLQPSEDCKVTSKYPDGTEVSRDCYVLSENAPELKPGTKGRFESCTQ